MNKPLRNFLIIMPLSTALVIGGFLYFAQEPAKKLFFDKLELADNPSERELGLMHRTDVCSSCGMLFVFEDSAPRSFWMKDTPTSLDIIFISPDGTITEIHNNTKPNSEEKYGSVGPTRYVLEAPAGYAQRQNIKVNDRLDVTHIANQAK